MNDTTTDRDWKAGAKEAVLALPNLSKLLYRLMRDSRVPARRKVTAGFAIAYVASPIDVVPDFIPFVGQVDDILLVTFAVHRLIESVEADVVDEYWDGSGDAYEVVAAILEWGADLVPKPIRRLLD
ncbi:MAG: DUF1232 domain-containing protein [Acidimicrobiia bacterium]|nr:DUF1232 domain-containing protein [Acidimicrobiia bacterium]NNK92323.1 DUF1232 domain-containing protein [Acidimicrobiia bacterium]